MKKDKHIRKENESKFKITDKNAMIILLILPFIYFLIFSPGLLTGSKMMYGSDWLLGGYPVREVISQQLAENKTMPLWYNYIFGGLPTIAGPYGDAASIYPFIRSIIPTHIFWTYLFIFGFVIAGIGMYLFLRSINISPTSALVGAICYSFAGNLVSTTYAGHEGRLWAAALFPLAFFFWNKGIISHKFFWFVFAGFTAGYAFMHGHFQLTYYGLLMAFSYFVITIILDYKQNRLKTTFKLISYAILSVITALGTLAVNLLPFYGNIKYSARGEIKGYEFAASWALAPKELLDLIIPQFSGILDNYWGSNMFKLHSEYFGIILLLLAILLLFIKIKERKTLFFSITSIVAVLIAFGGHTPFFKLIYNLLPGAKRFRGPSMIFYLVAFSIIILGSIGLQHIIDYNQQRKLFDESVKKKFKRYLYLIATIFVLIIGIFLITKSSLNVIIKDQQKIQAFTNNTSNFFTGTIITIVITVICLYLFYQTSTRKLKLNNLIIIIIPLLLFDLWRVDSKFLKSVDNPKTYYIKDDVINFLKNDTSFYRIHPLYYERSNDGILDLYNIQNVGGYCPNPVQRYQDFIGAENTVMFSSPNLAYSNFLNLLNVKYIVSVPLPDDISRYDTRTQITINQLRNFVKRPGIEIAYSGRRNIIYKNNNLLPRAFLVTNYEIIKDKKQIIEHLKNDNFNPLNTVILEENVSEYVSNQNDSIREYTNIIEYKPNKIVIETNNGNKFLVLSENYHNDWFCKVDGNPTKVYPAYYTLRAIYLPAGQHKVEFYYFSSLYNIGRIITLISLTFTGVVIIFTIYKKKRRKDTKSEVSHSVSF